jgi:tetrathionate reductase subunit C
MKLSGRARPILIGFLVFSLVMLSGIASAENGPPTDVTILADASIAKVGKEVRFRGSAIDPDNDALTYQWDFGDGFVGTGQNAKHTYNESGEFMVTLTVDDGNGNIATGTLTLSVRTHTYSANGDFIVTYDVPNEMTWGILIVMYIFFTGMSAGSFVLSSLGYVFGIEKYKPFAKIGAMLATILLMVAPLFLILDLEQPFMFYTTLFNFNPTSVISWGVYLLTIYPLVCLVYGWFLFRENFVRTMEGSKSKLKKRFYGLLTLGKTSLSEKSLAKDKKYARLFGTLGVPLAIAVHGYTGFLLATVAARDLWNTSLMPVIFLVSAIVSGIALFIIVLIVKNRFFTKSKSIDRNSMFDLGKLLSWMIIIDIMLIVFELIVLAYSGTEGSEALWLLLSGPFSTTFLVVEIFIGAIIPVVILLYPATGRSTIGQLTASILVLIGIVAMRYNVIVGGQAIPIVGFGIVEYSMTFRDLMISVGVIALTAIVIATALKILPFDVEDSDILRGGRRRRLSGAGAVQDEEQLSIEREAKSIRVEAAMSNKGLSRRDFLKKGALCGGAVVAAMSLPILSTMSARAESGTTSASDYPRKRYAMVIDVRKCMGCHSCTQACKTEFDVPPGVWRSWVMKIKKKRGSSESDHFLPRLCNHCDNPPCVKACPVGATYKHKDGPVLQRYDKCIGCKYCIVACPYNARFINPKTKVTDKCTFCIHRSESGRVPACVAACPAKARSFGDIDDSESEVSALLATQPTQVLKPELNTRPMVFYIGADQTIMRSGIPEMHDK